MNHLTKTPQLLKSYDIDPIRGFLPGTDPLTTLPAVFKAWDDLGANFTDYLNAGIIRTKIENLELIEAPVFETKAEQERAMLLLSMFAHAYVNSPKKRNYIPACISIPWVKIAQQLGREPILSHASLVLNNWRRLDPDHPIQMDNLATLFQFHGGLDESWFYLITVAIEQVGAPAISLLLDGLDHLNNGRIEQAIAILEQVSTILSKMTDTLRDMYLHCNPPVFYKRIRPFLDSFVGVDYQGTALKNQHFHGGSAAQSSLIQSFDAFFGMRYDEIPKTQQYLSAMRKYMPSKHAAFLAYLESNPNYKNFVEQDASFKMAYDTALQQLIQFRNEHLKMVGIYIMQQAKAENSEAKGTGGTNPLLFLKSIRNKNKN